MSAKQDNLNVYMQENLVIKKKKKKVYKLMWPQGNIGSNLCTDSYEPVYSMLNHTWKQKRYHQAGQQNGPLLS